MKTTLLAALALTACSLFAFTAPAAAQGMALTYSVHQKTKITSVSPQQVTSKIILKFEDEESTVDNVVTLLPTLLGIRAGKEERIYDFDKKIYTLIDHDKKIYNVMPLHTLPRGRKRGEERKDCRQAEARDEKAGIFRSRRKRNISLV